MNEEITRLGKQTLQSGWPAAQLYRRYIAPFVFGPLPPYNLNSPELHHGSVFFMESKKARFGVTCAHCVDGFRTEYKSKPNIFLMIGDKIVFDFEERLIDYDKDLDLCTFRISKEEISEVNKESSFLDWTPQPTIPEGASVAIIGFPAHIVRPQDQNTLSIGSLCIFELLREGNSSYTGMIIEFEMGEWVHAVNQSQFKIDDVEHFGGLSGCPVLFWANLRPVLAGIVFESPISNAGEKLAYQYVKARYNLIDENGKIQRLL